MSKYSACFQLKSCLVDWRILAVTQFVGILVILGGLLLSPMIESSEHLTHSEFVSTFFDAIDNLYRWSDPIGFIACLNAAVCVVIMVVWLITQIIGSVSNRSICSWGTWIICLSVWLCLLGNWHSVAWKSKVLRIGATNPFTESFVIQLTQEWPNEDGDYPLLGSVLAYPPGAPTTLILLRPPITLHGLPTINQIDRLPTGGIGFGLADHQEQDWIEWHPCSKAPSNYRNGLYSEMHPQRMASLGEGWFLVRYSIPTTQP